MGRTPTATTDPTLQRLHEVAERIRRRAAEARERERAVRPGAGPVAIDPRPPVRSVPAPLPRHWSDGPADDADEPTHH